MTHHGWRKPTPGLVVAEQHAQVGERLAVPKSQAIVAVKKVAAAIGLKAPDMLLIDTLAAVTQPQDWKEGQRPIVWPSNAYLMEQCGFSLPALKRHLRRLAEAGVMSFVDSPNGKRWGKRDDEGNIVEAYGLDLAPMAARTAEFEALHAKMVEERALCQSLRNSITISRRVIRAKIEKALENCLRGPWRDLQAEFELALERLPRRSETSHKLMDLADWFGALKEKVEQAFTAAFDWPEESDVRPTDRTSDTESQNSSFSQKMNPTGLASDPHIQTTNQPDLVTSNSFEHKAARSAPPETEARPLVENDSADLDDIQWSTYENKRTSDVELTTVMAACSEFGDMARAMVGGYVKNWDDLHRAAGLLRPSCGISEDAWNVAQQKLGPYVAAAAIALIYDKHAKGEVASAGGYLRGIVGKALEGDLHLERSFYGRLSQIQGSHS